MQNYISEKRKGRDFLPQADPLTWLCMVGRELKDKGALIVKPQPLFSVNRGYTVNSSLGLCVPAAGNPTELLPPKLQRLGKTNH